VKKEQHLVVEIPRFETVQHISYPKQNYWVPRMGL